MVLLVACHVCHRKEKTAGDLVCPCGLPCRLLYSTGSCGTAKLKWKTHRTAEPNRIAAGGSMAKGFHPCTAILKSHRVSEAFGEKSTLRCCPI